MHNSCLEKTLELFLGNGNAWFAVLIGVGLPVLIGVLKPVVPFPIRMPVVPEHMSLCWFPDVPWLLPLSLVWCSSPRKSPCSKGWQGSSDNQVGCTWLQGPSSGCWCWFSAACWSPSLPSSGQRTLGSAPAFCLSIWSLTQSLTGFFDECACFAEQCLESD